MLGWFLEGPGWYSEGAWVVRGGCLGGSWKVHGWYLEGAWVVPTRCPGDALVDLCIEGGRGMLLAAQTGRRARGSSALSNNNNTPKTRCVAAWQGYLPILVLITVND